MLAAYQDRCPMSAFGTKRTCSSAQRCPLSGVKRTLVAHSEMTAFDPRRKSACSRFPVHCAEPVTAPGRSHGKILHVFRGAVRCVVPCRFRADGEFFAYFPPILP